ncbi:MAG TPA: hypothetical protein VNK96_05295 [Fimbriimonadales bacterium]|nr:hypothetical protein [Fimbriimonadales bacterium]
MVGKIVFWSAIAILGLIFIGLVAGGVTLWRFFSSEEGKQFQRTMQLSQQMEDILPHVVSALQQYKDAKGKFPEKFEELKPYMVESVYEKSNNLLKYTPPKPDAPDNTVIMTTEKWQTIQEGTMHYEIRKNLQAVMITEQPIVKKGEQRTQGKVKPGDAGALSILLPMAK